MRPKIGIVAALEREVAPLTRKFAKRNDGPKDLAIFEKKGIWLVCSGMGGKQAAAATAWLIATHKPEVVMSVGFAGALAPGYRAGDVITPGTVIDGATGERFSASDDQGVLVSNTGILGEAGKRQLAAQFGAQAVDMEAAAVARVAQERSVVFCAVKAISDELDFAMPPMDRFVTEAGKLNTLQFLSYVAVRPSSWPAVAQLGANSRKASSQLCRWLENQISRDFQEVMCGLRTKPRS